jgi:hypothetical protein
MSREQGNIEKAHAEVVAQNSPPQPPPVSRQLMHIRNQLSLTTITP